MQSIIFFIGLSVFSLFLVLLHLLQQLIDRRISKRTGTADDNHTPPGIEQDDIEKAHLGPIANAIGAYQRQRHTHEYDRAEREKITIKVLIFTAIVATTAAIAALGSNWFFWGQLVEMQQEKRAWVSIDIPHFTNPITFNVDGVMFYLEFTFNNYGRSPAQNVFTYFEVFPSLPCHDSNECGLIRNHVCNIASRISEAGLTIFPGEHPKSREANYIKRRELPVKSTVIWPEIVICVSYTVADQSSFKHTWYGFDVIRTDGDNMISITDKAIRADELKMRHNPFGLTGAS